MKIRKETAGTDSHGHAWETDGAVVEMEPETAATLLAIPDGGFSIVEDEPDAKAGSKPAPPAARAAAK